MGNILHINIPMYLYPIIIYINIYHIYKYMIPRHTYKLIEIFLKKGEFNNIIMYSTFQNTIVYHVLHYVIVYHVLHYVIVYHVLHYVIVYYFTVTTVQCSIYIYDKMIENKTCPIFYITICCRARRALLVALLRHAPKHAPKYALSD